MARPSNRFSALQVARLKKPGRYGDGGGLWLQVSEAGTKSWLFRYMRHGRARQMGLGSFADVSLAQARTKASEARRLLRSGTDPIDARRNEITAARLADARSITFQEAAEAYIASHKAGWRNEKHAKQWGASLESTAYPVFGRLPVQAVDVAMVMKVLEPIWSTKTETASRVRGRIESVLDWARARGYREGENPARWRGHLDNLLPARSKVRKVQHHPALPFMEIGVFFEDLRDQDGTAARALEFLILTAARTGEVIGTRWSEIDLKEALWLVPSERVKSGREHRVPLSAPALAILRSLPGECDPEAFVFPGGRPGYPLSNMALLALLKRMKRDDLTAHGFRSTFRDWTAERTNYPRDVAEMALGHIVSDKTEAAYRRGDLFRKRRRLMEDWAKFCETPRPTGKVVTFGKR